MSADFENRELTAHTTQLQQAARAVLVQASTVISEGSIIEDTSGYNPSLHGIHIDDERRRLNDDWNRRTITGDENGNQIRFQSESSISVDDSTVVEGHHELDESDLNKDQSAYRSIDRGRQVF